MSADARGAVHRLRRRVYDILDNGVSDTAAWYVHALLVALVVVSVASVVLETVPEWRAEYGRLFLAIEIVAAIGFTLEYALRLWCAPEITAYSDMSPARARLEWARTPYAIIDLLTVAPLYLNFAAAEDLRILVLLRLLRFLKLARYSPGMRSLITALRAEKRALGASAVIIFGVILLMATAMHIAEHRAQPDRFGSIPQAMWWATITVTTVGYGDVVPVTAIGKIIASFAAVTGFLLLGLPVGIMATAFAEEIHRREFVVTWSMLARVPLFSELDAAAIAELMNHLRAQTFPAGALVVRRGDEAHSMFFVAAGEVEVELPDGRVPIGEGQFFGEVALLRDTKRTASIRTRTRTKLLALDAHDLHVLMSRNPQMRRSIEHVIETRGYGKLAARDDSKTEPTAGD
ncbi:MAG: cyclic nucleotide-gated ion channel [Beijerinckiaceae bacterium]